MESIGEKLKKTRESKKLTIRDVARDSNIATIYLEALENEDFDKFPGETYVIGFIRSYSDYLKLDADEIVQAYKGYKIGESVTPLEELTRPTRPGINVDLSTVVKSYKNLIIGGVAFVGIILMVVLFQGLSGDEISIDDTSNDTITALKEEHKAKEGADESKKVESIEIRNDKGFVFMHKDEVRQFLLNNQTVSFVLKNITDKSVDIEFSHNKSQETLFNNQAKKFVFEGYEREFSLKLKGTTKNRAQIGVILGKELKIQGPAVVKVADKKENVKATTDVVAQNKKNLKIVFEVAFSAKTYLELYLDGQKKFGGIMQPGDKDRWEASEFIQVKIGNAGGLKAKINKKEYIFGPTGTVANKVIKWKKDASNPNLYHIVVKDW